MPPLRHGQAASVRPLWSTRTARRTQTTTSKHPTISIICMKDGGVQSMVWSVTCHMLCGVSPVICCVCATSRSLFTASLPQVCLLSPQIDHKMFISIVKSASFCRKFTACFLAASLPQFSFFPYFRTLFTTSVDSLDV